MRLATAAVLLLGSMGWGCMDSQPPDQGGWTLPPDPGPTGEYCETDSQCGTQVCARDGSCQDPSNLYTVHVTWTISGQPASATSCTNAGDLQIEFDGYETFGFAPVPCAEGKFSVDKLPLQYTRVDLSRENGNDAGASGDIPMTGTVALDLPY